MESLTPREVEVVAQVRQAKSNKQIAKALGISEGTAKQYLYRICLKLNLPNRTALAMWKPE